MYKVIPLPSTRISPRVGSAATLSSASSAAPAGAVLIGVANGVLTAVSGVGRLVVGVELPAPWNAPGVETSCVAWAVGAQAATKREINARIPTNETGFIFVLWFSFVFIIKFLLRNITYS
jgi:hypothetical protein